MTAAPAPANDLVGAILSQKYSLKRLIGSGGMGSVYESQSPEDGKRVAIKVLAVEYLHDDDVKMRFLDEGRMCQRLIHPNIVRVFDTAQAEDGTPYIVMELLDGVPLSAYTRSGVRVPMPQAVAILQGILAGLGAAHTQQIVHRDLKPENVVLARDLAGGAGGAFAAKILDFGIAKVMDAAGGMGSKTRTGVLLGTPAYMSPEQIKNAKDVDARTDLWSAGVMLYEMLTGRVAFPAPTEYARLSAVLNNNPPPLESVDPNLARLSAFVQLAMQKDRDKRFQSALEMARALTATVGTSETGATTTANPAASPLSRLPDVPSVWMPVGLAPHAGATPGGRGAPSAPPPATQTNPPPPATAAEAGRPDKGPGGTLASKMGHSPSGHPPAPQVAIIGASQGTLPSENLPMFAPARGKRGIAVPIVIVLVLVGIVAGFLLGLAAARLI